MELREAIGRRRSIRFLDPGRQVEVEKVQRMLEAARLASHWGNVQSLRAVVVMKETAPREVIDALQAPVAGYQIKLAPVVIVWYLDTSAVDEQSDRLRELVDCGALGYGDDKRAALEETLIPMFNSILDSLKSPGLGEVDCGQGIAHATLVAYEQGLGTCCLGTPYTDQIRQNLGMPEHCRVLCLQTVGYPAEDPEAGGQRPRRPFEEIFHLNGYGNGFPRSQAVVDELAADGMLTAPAPLPGREDELKTLQERLGLKGHGLF
ncbi:MAG: nitroreductase family protein [Acidimicrobiia bacterium]|nr:nitroreductase family protein [Acidimicrobiia bacterium]